MEAGGKFFADDVMQIGFLIGKACIQGVGQWRAEGGKCTLTVDMGENIGFEDPGGRRTSLLKVVITNEPNTKVLTAYPARR